MYQEASLMYGFDFTDPDTPIGPLIKEILDGKYDRHDRDTRPKWANDFWTPYCGYAPDYDPRAFGVICGSWDETEEEEGERWWDFGDNGADFHFVGLETEEEVEEAVKQAKSEFAEIWETLPEELKQELQALGEPNFFMLWSTS